MSVGLNLPRRRSSLSQTPHSSAGVCTGAGAQPFSQMLVKRSTTESQPSSATTSG